MYKLKDWIDINKLDWYRLFISIQCAISLLENNIDKIDWKILSRNYSAITYLIKKY